MLAFEDLNCINPLCLKPKVRMLKTDFRDITYLNLAKTFCNL